MAWATQYREFDESPAIACLECWDQDLAEAGRRHANQSAKMRGGWKSFIG